MPRPGAEPQRSRERSLVATPLSCVQEEAAPGVREGDAAACTLSRSVLARTHVCPVRVAPQRDPSPLGCSPSVVAQEANAKASRLPHRVAHLAPGALLHQRARARIQGQPRIQGPAFTVPCSEELSRQRLHRWWRLRQQQRQRLRQRRLWQWWWHPRRLRQPACGTADDRCSCCEHACDSACSVGEEAAEAGRRNGSLRRTDHRGQLARQHVASAAGPRPRPRRRAILPAHGRRPRARLRPPSRVHAPRLPRAARPVGEGL